MKYELYMDRTDFYHEIDGQKTGTKVYPSIEAVKKDNCCWEECGIVRVKVELLETAIQGDYRKGSVLSKKESNKLRLAHYQNVLNQHEDQIYKIKKIIEKIESELR